MKFENKQKEHEKKLKAINTHQHMVSRVFAKNFLRDLQKDSLVILENQGYFVDESIKEVKEEFMPWLYSQVFTEVKSHHKIENFLKSSLLFNIRTNISNDRLQSANSHLDSSS